jgi:hypothetical protein
VLTIKSPTIRFGLKVRFSEPDWSQYLNDNPGVTARQLSPEDANGEDGLAISRLYHEVSQIPLAAGQSLEDNYRRHNQAAIANPPNFFYLVKKEGNPIGTIAYRMTQLPKVAEVTNFFISYDDRGKLGLLLMRQMVWKALRQGITFLMMGAKNDNKQLINVYKGLVGDPIGETTQSGFAPVASVFAYPLGSEELTEEWREKLLAEYNRIQRQRATDCSFSSAA